MKLKLKLLTLMTLLFVLAGAAQAQESPTVVLVIRHAEKATGNDDPGLSEAGVKRAAELAGIAEEAGVAAIYTTQYKRALETGQAVATRLGLTVTPVEITKENAAAYPAALAKMILTKNAGKGVLVIGHSNTVPLIVEALGGKRPAPINDATEFDRLFVVIIPKTGAVRVVSARYGS